MSHHAKHKGLVGGLLASGGLLFFSCWLTGLTRMNGLEKACAVPVVVMVLLSIFLELLR